MTVTEARLLLTLLDKPQQSLSREAIFEAMGRQYAPLDRTVDVLHHLLNTVCSFHPSVRWHANVEGLAKHFADLQRHLVISEPKG